MVNYITDERYFRIFKMTYLQYKNTNQIINSPNLNNQRMFGSFFDYLDVVKIMNF